jgi:type IV secretion system protein VirB8
MTEPVNEERDTAYANTRSWALDRADTLARWARAGWIVAAIATTVAVLEAFALVSLTPLKTVVPYTLLVDRTTGYTQTLEGLHPQTIKPETALTQSLLAQYVIARESFDIISVKDQYRRVGLWSAANARRDYLALIPASNPQSPINIYPRNAVLDANVSSVDTARSGKARVRFTTERRDTASTAPERTWWVAEIDYKFTAEPLTAADRLENPLGFSVTRYRRFQENPPVAPPSLPLARSNPQQVQSDISTEPLSSTEFPPPVEDIQ